MPDPFAPTVGDSHHPVLSRWLRVLTFLFAMILSSHTRAEPARTLDRYLSGGKEIRVETFSICPAPTTPSVIVLHGTTGVEFANRFIAHLAEGFAEQGFVVHLVHYFDRTGSRYADDATIRKSSPLWIQTVDDAITYVHSKRPQAPIGLFGYSLGGYLTAAETVSNPRVRAAVVLAGGLDEATARSAQHAPPVLILHGDSDTRVPLSEARRLERTLTRLGGPPAMHVFPGEGHIMSLPAYADVVQRSVRHLRLNLDR